MGKKTGLFSAAQMLEQDCCDSPPDLDEQRISVRHMSGMSEIFFEHCEFSGIFSILSILKIWLPNGVKHGSMAHIYLSIK